MNVLTLSFKARVYERCTGQLPKALVHKPPPLPSRTATTQPMKQAQMPEKHAKSRQSMRSSTLRHFNNLRRRETKAEQTRTSARAPHGRRPNGRRGKERRPSRLEPKAKGGTFVRTLEEVEIPYAILLRIHQAYWALFGGSEASSREAGRRDSDVFGRTGPKTSEICDCGGGGGGTRAGGI